MANCWHERNAFNSSKLRGPAERATAGQAKVGMKRLPQAVGRGATAVPSSEEWPRPSQPLAQVHGEWPSADSKPMDALRPLYRARSAPVTQCAPRLAT
mmetsp:Transcript_6494/g.18148  ORF Transcript_6494/g.18148 Transcript_6494/m.18148 type:complete len:98 (+) Transcript_6494:745-1038(+)